MPLEPKSPSDFEPKNPEDFQNALADNLNTLLDNPELSKKFGEASRKRAIDVFSWKSIAKQTFNFYETIIARYKAEGMRKK